MTGDAEILWRRLDAAGHDGCRLVGQGGLWLLSGTAVWLDGGMPAVMAYEVTADAGWITRSARLRGRSGGRDRSFSIQRDEAGNWRMNGEAVPEVTGLRDGDLGFTPATNLLPIRRLLAAGAAQADIGAAWLDPADWTLKPLPQTYRKEGQGWHYASPSHGFEALLTVDRDGFVTDYPGLWVKEG